VVTTGEANVYPADLPVGSVHLSAAGVVQVIPQAQLDRLDIVRLFDYGLRGLVPPEAPIQKRVTAAAQALPPAPETWHTAPDRDPDNRAAYIAALRTPQQAIQQAAIAARAAAIHAATTVPGTPVPPDATPD
jgi:hypothetical protein